MSLLCLLSRKVLKILPLVLGVAAYADNKQMSAYSYQSMCFSEHVNCMVARAHMRASQFLRCFLSRDPLAYIEEFNIYFRLLVKYCSPKCHGHIGPLY